jgi:hypothetical protein
MSTVGGDLLEIRASHPTLGNHVFYPKSNEGNTIDPGGVRTGDDVNMISGDGQPIWQKNLVRGHVEVVVANDVNTRKDMNFAAALAKSPVPADFTFSHISGVTWGLTGMPVGDIAPDLNVSTFTLKIAGGQPEYIVG